MVDLSTKIGEYRELTQCAILVKMIRDWKLLFLFNKPLYEDSGLVTATEEEEGEKGEGEREKGGEGESISLQSTSTVDDKNAEADDILDDADLQEYLQVTNEWSSDSTECPHPPNMVLSHIMYRLIELVKPPQFYLRGSFVGLPFTRKTSSLKYINESIIL
ncbi:PREDICTED: sperm flagellar protein 2-like isoform X2 [Amphimedon queenslandica]|uniref:CPC1/SPEF2 domain-containing protein n=1 Tax=Amphimedon queenslandica TaxID=400682 RepID=A0AAN0JUF7_AMPQE|nr:PREDICTED: sperm flagellar protein 2-like isoform X2 [Amphimedon queenslandica]|eukprot:XP_019860526.1 PREDICTED: sperm flagellar protein 2-like isoform X2 [Amphimedon queenslandica]